VRTEISSENKETDAVTPVPLVERVLHAAGAIIFAGMEKGMDIRIRLAHAGSAAIAVCAA
jgi:hypothetical protein